MNHLDCSFYLAVDVFKGICKRTKERILADDASCKQFKQVPKCKWCQHFTATDDQLGICMGQATAYPEMRALTCLDFTC